MSVFIIYNIKTISKTYGVVHLSTGDMLREAKEDPMFAPYMSAGKLVPDNVIVEMVVKRLRKPEKLLSKVILPIQA